jgi:hypothetical protein
MPCPEPRGEAMRRGEFIALVGSAVAAWRPDGLRSQGRKARDSPIVQSGQVRADHQTQGRKITGPYVAIGDHDV